MVEVFSLRSLGMGMAKFDLLEETTNEKNESERSALTLGSFFKGVLYILSLPGIRVSIFSS